MACLILSFWYAIKPYKISNLSPLILTTCWRVHLEQVSGPFRTFDIAAAFELELPAKASHLASPLP